MTTPDLSNFYRTTANDLVALRRQLHQIPEPGLDLPQTQAAILAQLEGLPLEITLGKSVSSITAVLRGRAELPAQTVRPVVLLRGDMDALPVAERTGLDYASTNGAMHACGHDLHMSILVGAVKGLCAVADRLSADVIFMFQPGEEGHSGAAAMLAEGVLDAAGRRPDAAYAIHVFSALRPGGVFFTTPGTMMAASDTLRVTVHGKGGHGSAPQLSLDPVPAACEMVLGTQTLIARHFDVFDPVVITVGMLRAGSACNVIPESAHFEATLRSFSQAAQQRLFELLPPMINGIAAAHGVSAEISFEKLYPPTVNTPDAAQRVVATAKELFGEQRVELMSYPLTTAEDFSQVLLEVPGAFIGLSAVPKDADPATAPYNHSDHAIYDDSVIIDGAQLLAELALRTTTAKQMV